MAFLALVHRFNPEKTKVDYNAHTKDNPEHNLSVAFELAEQELGIPKLLDTKEVFEGKVDERSLVLYTSLFFHAFKAAEVSWRFIVLVNSNVCSGCSRFGETKVGN